jgi:hypothetical protein
MGTWRVPATGLTNLTGSMLAGAGPDSCAVIVVGSGTADIVFAADVIYLDGSPTPSSIAALASGWTPASAYTFHWHATCIDATDVVAVSLGAGLTAAGPVFDAAIDSALTGATRAVVAAFAAGTTLVTINATTQGGFGNLLNVPPGETITWFEGTYTASPPVPFRFKLPPLPSRTPIAQGGGRKRG